MDKESLMNMAQETVKILREGKYNRGGRVKFIAKEVQNCVDKSQFCTVAEMHDKHERIARLKSPGYPTKFDVLLETSITAILRLSYAGLKDLTVLNFASAKHPGGGFLKGSQAQEESLARTSALYSSLHAFPDFYTNKTQGTTPLYSHAMIFTPVCPVFRQDDGSFLEEPIFTNFITSPAPKKVEASEAEKKKIPNILDERIERILALAVAKKCKHLVLGAWGCGVFGNDPELVASIFHKYLFGSYQGRFKTVCFSIWDTSEEKKIFTPFRKIFS